MIDRRRLLSGASIAFVTLAFAGAAPGADITVRELAQRLHGADRSAPLQLRGLDLHELDLSGLDFKAASLAGSNLFGADLSGTDLSGADLQGARLDRVVIIGTRF
ncbi:MAG TPA: pentapeptide repeat-containing protein, partial [Hyphomicrobium sp.]|nr:pentapeptide repeat-containing protein [Hyphomicrobium sp.]